MADNLNFTPQRGPNVWDRRPLQDRDEARRKREIGAAVLLAAGAVSAFAGGMMLYRAMRDDRERDVGATRPVATTDRESADQVNEESQQSFPASDAPSWTPGNGATLDLPRRTS